jgi:hypothetical protein
MTLSASFDADPRSLTKDDIPDGCRMFASPVRLAVERTWVEKEMIRLLSLSLKRFLVDSVEAMEGCHFW